jgi:hypothetical protein
MGNSSSTKSFLPSLKAIKSPITFQEYPSNTLNQVFEAYGNWLNSDYSKKGTLFSAEFEEVFGQLFPDPLPHFYKLNDTAMNACVTLDLFYLFLLFCDASMETKWKSIYEINNKGDLKTPMKLEALQSMIYRMIAVFPLAFKVSTPSKDEIFVFLENSFQKFLERIHCNDYNTIDNHGISGKSSHVSPTPATGVGSSSFFSSSNASLSFDELWQWSQDVILVSQFTEAIDEICLSVNSTIDQTYKGKQWILRNSFFSNHSFALSNNLNLRSSFRFGSFPMGGTRGSMGSTTANNDLLFNIIQEVTKKVDQGDYFLNYLLSKRHPLWSFTIKEIGNCETWSHNVALPLVYSDQKVWHGLEQMILSQEGMLPILHKQQQNQAGHTHHHQESKSGGILMSKANLHHLQQHQHQHQHRTGQSTNAVSQHHHQTSHRSIREQNNVSSSSRLAPHPPSDSSRPGSNHRSAQQGESRGGGGISGGFQQTTFRSKTEFLGVIDYSSILSWIIETAPSIVFRELRKQEQIIRSKRLSFEFSFNKKEDHTLPTKEKENNQQSFSLTDHLGNQVQIGGEASNRNKPKGNTGEEALPVIEFSDSDDDDTRELSYHREKNYDYFFQDLHVTADGKVIGRIDEKVNENEEEATVENLSSGEKEKMKRVQQRRSSVSTGDNYNSQGGRSFSAPISTTGEKEDAFDVDAGGAIDSITKLVSLSAQSRQSSSKFSFSRYSSSKSLRKQQLNTNKLTNKLQKWQMIGERIVHASLDKLFASSLKLFPSLHRKFPDSLVMTTNQSIYNAILVFAKGYRHLPISYEPCNHFKIFHIIKSYEIAHFFYENYYDFFAASSSSSSSSTSSSPTAGKKADSPRLGSRSGSPTNNNQDKMKSKSVDTTDDSHATSAKNQLFNRPIVYTGLMKRPFFICNPKKLEIPEGMNTSSSVAASLSAMLLSMNHPEDHDEDIEHHQHHFQPPVRYNLGCLLHQLLSSTYDSMLITNERNKVISVLSIHIIEELWWNWKKRIYQKQYNTLLEKEDLYREYELGSYLFFDEGDGSTSNDYSRNSSISMSSSHAIVTSSLLSNLKTIPSFGGALSTNRAPSFTPSFNLHRVSDAANPSFGANSSSNPASVKGNFSFFSILMNSLEQCKEILNLKIIDFEDYLLLEEERIKMALEAAAAAEAALKAEAKNSRGKSRQKTPKSKNRRKISSPDKQPQLQQSAEQQPHQPPPQSSPSPEAKSPKSTKPSKNVKAKDTASSKIVVPPQSPPASDNEAASSRSPSPTSSKPVSRAKKSHGGKIFKKYGNFGNLAAFQQHLQQEKEREESRIKVLFLLCLFFPLY